MYPKKYKIIKKIITKKIKSTPKNTPITFLPQKNTKIFMDQKKIPEFKIMTPK